jgi:spore coat polysaccharide biosynthesis protein SpsF
MNKRSWYVLPSGTPSKVRQEMSEREEWVNSRIDSDPRRSGSVMAFLQARMGSTRLRGKVLMPIRGQSILERAIRRLRASRVIDEVAVLTTHLREDDAVVEASLELGAWVHRGPELDVLARFQEAANRFQPDIIIRATADNPLIDIDSIEPIVENLCSGKLDLCIQRGLPYGAATEALTAEALTRTHLVAREPRHREHVTLYMKEHPEAFLTSFWMAPKPLCFPQVRLTVDTPEDLRFVDRLICSLPDGGQTVPLSEYLPVALEILQERECKALASS